MAADNLSPMDSVEIETDDDKVGLASAESMIASDPPGYLAQRVGTPVEAPSPVTQAVREAFGCADRAVIDTADAAWRFINEKPVQALIVAGVVGYLLGTFRDRR